MPYRFGAATTDHVTIATGGTYAAATSAHFVYGWWRPTTLTATRGLWSIGPTTGAEIDTVTDELRMRSLAATTVGLFTTAGVDLIVNEWKFLAWFFTLNAAGVTAAWRVWAGDVMNHPVAVPVTQATAPAGAWTGSGNFTIGNKDAGTLAFQGDIAQVGFGFTLTNFTNTQHPYNFGSAFGAIDANGEDHMLTRFVRPAWRGEYPWLAGNGLYGSVQGEAFWRRWHNPLRPGAAYVGIGSPTDIMPKTVTLLGATESQEGEPRPLMGSPMFPSVRR